MLAPGSEAAEPSVSLDVQAAPECTSRSDIVARVASRSTRIHFVDADASTSVEARFAADRSGGMTGELVVSGPGRKALSRRVAARSCTEAADAVALIIVVTLDPTSLKDGPGTTPESASVTPPADSAGDKSSNAETSPVPAAKANEPAHEQRPSPAKHPATPVVAPTVVPSPPVAPAASRRVSVNLAGLAIVGPAPAVMPGIGIYAMAALDRDAVLSPALVIGAMHAWRSGFVEGGGTASFALDAASLDGCALRVRLSRFEARACASALVGRLSASGTDTSNPRSYARPFAAVGGAAVMGVRLGSMFELSPRLGLGTTLIRDWYMFGPNVFHRADPLTIDAGLGVGVRWP